MASEPKARRSRRSGRLTLGKYELVQRLGRGGMAEVWRAKIIGPAGFERQLVVKRILPHLAEEAQFVKMFVAEARLCARLSHPNIVQVFELGDVDGEYFLAMEYVRGKDLISVVRSFLPQGGPPIGLAAYAMRETCRALEYAHSFCDEEGRPLRVVHRDVTPSNVMISYEGVVKLLDFGVAKALAEVNDMKTQTGMVKGKFGYMSPEQLETGPNAFIDHRADIFAAGIVLHEVLTGDRLFKGSNELHTIARVRESAIPPPSKLNPSVTRELDRICMHALERDREKRYQSCAEMASDLDLVVRHLGWDQERTARTLREMFTAEATEPQGMPGSNARGWGSEAASHRLRSAAFVIAGLVAAGAAAAVALPHAFRQVRAKPVTAQVAPPQEKAPAEAGFPAVRPQLEAPRREVQVLVDSKPTGAGVFVAGEQHPRGATPLVLSLARSGRSVSVEVRAPGYQPSRADVTPLLDSQLKLVLVREAPQVSVKHLPPPRGKRAQAAQGPQGPRPPDVRKGDVVDPFGE
jgi:tRNA A-37 threonylcarbamoyl transferase component Bud32